MNANLVKVILVSMPSHDVVEHTAEKTSVAMSFGFCTACQRPRYVTEYLQYTPQYNLSTQDVILHHGLIGFIQLSN